MRLRSFMPLKGRMPIRALICGFGNTSARNTIANGRGLLTLAGRADVPLYAGVEKPYKQHPLETDTVSAGDFVGTNGLCGVVLPVNDSVRPANQGLDDDGKLRRIVEFIQAAGPLTYIVTGPCSTLAHVLDSLGADASRSISNIILMGGALDVPGNHGPINPETGKSYAEFNFYCDPLAVETVLNSGIEVTIVPWDLTETITIDYNALAGLRAAGDCGEFVLELMKSFLESYGIKNNRPFEFNDCINLVAHEGVGRHREERIRVITSGEQAGRIIRCEHGVPVKFFDLDEGERAPARDHILKTIGIGRF